MEKQTLENIALLLLLGMNVLSFVLMGVDKRRARQNRWRISERTLLLVSGLFGSLGGLLGMRCFHHKTKHRRFAVGIPVMLVVQTLLLLGLAYRYGY